MLQVPLPLTPLRNGVHATRKDGNITLIQRFQSGRAPTSCVKGHDSQLLLELCAGARVRTRFRVPVGDVMSDTATHCAARLQFLVQEMHGYGPMAGPLKWLLPHRNSPHVEAASPLPEYREPGGAVEETGSLTQGISQETETNDSVKHIQNNHFSSEIDLSNAMKDMGASCVAEDSERKEKNPQQPPQLSASQVDVRLVRLWLEVFGESAPQRSQ
ncbi:hypothetical protein E2C01_030174 [Portunus trituberculatus]|uniref:Uncharacterized protein n=1 Tax=Portunus trituberculatus TaxID=210409 RepID=A0A5B7EU74_PORTR|nr:hypothetical protein [Portunus trituberculatus]